MEARKKVVAISHDYDDCGDILFKEIKTTYRPADIAPADKCEEKLKSYLQEITEGADAELYVGSIRQDIQNDEFNMSHNSNGSCFKNYASLCKENNWLFREFLLADANNNLPAGTAMKNRDITGPAFIKKSCLIEHQLNDVKNNHPDADVYFYFLDDDLNNVHFKDIKEFIESHPLPNNIKKFSLVRFNWNEEVNIHLEKINKSHLSEQGFFSAPKVEFTSRLLEVVYCKEQMENAVTEAPSFRSAI